MKSMKRMLSLLLVALLLVSAVPMMASAETHEGEFPQPDVVDEPGDPSGGSSGDATSGEAGVVYSRQGDPDQPDEPNLLSDQSARTITPTSITVNAVLITHDASGGNSRTSTINGPFAKDATLGDVLRGANGLNQSARTNGISEYQKYDYEFKQCDDEADFYAVDQYGDYDYANVAHWKLSEIAGNATTVYLQFYRTRKTATVGLKLDGSNYGVRTKQNVPLYTTLNLPAEFSALKLAPSTGYYIAYYEEQGVAGRPIASPTSYLVTGETTIVGYQDLLVNKPINEGNVNTSGGSGTIGGSGSGSTGGSGTGTIAKFTVRFLNVYGVEFYNEEVANGNRVTATAEFLNSSVGSRDGYTHIGWRVGSGSTKATGVVINEKIYNNVTYTPVFTNASGAIVTPGTGSGTTGVGSDGTIGSNPSTSGTNKFQHVYLNIYKDTMVGSADKRVEITNGIAVDKWVTLDEVKSVVKNYYTAKTSSDGISYDGLYLEGRWAANYVANNKYSTVDLRSSQDDNVFINVMISNAKVKSSSTADTSNPKTGDSIYAPVAVLGVSATALAAVMYVYSKKRLAR